MGPDVGSRSPTRSSVTTRRGFAEHKHPDGVRSAFFPNLVASRAQCPKARIRESSVIPSKGPEYPQSGKISRTKQLIASAVACNDHRQQNTTEAWTPGMVWLGVGNCLVNSQCEGDSQQTPTLMRLPAIISSRSNTKEWLEEPKIATHSNHAHIPTGDTLRGCYDLRWACFDSRKESKKC